MCYKMFVSNLKLFFFSKMLQEIKEACKVMLEILHKQDYIYRLRFCMWICKNLQSSTWSYQMLQFHYKSSTNYYNNIIWQKAVWLENVSLFLQVQVFEKVLVQNILFGLSPGFTNSLQLIPRWRFVVATMPHVMHCVASMLQHRYDSKIIFIVVFRRV